MNTWPARNETAMKTEKTTPETDNPTYRSRPADDGGTYFLMPRDAHLIKEPTEADQAPIGPLVEPPLP